MPHTQRTIFQKKKFTKNFDDAHNPIGTLNEVVQ